MKALSLAVVAAGLACGAFGQGWFELDNSGLTNRVGAPGYPYSGPFGLEVWEFGGYDPSLIDSINWAGVPNPADWWYSGATPEADYNGQMTNGIFQLGACRMPDVTPPGSTVTLVLVAWTGSASNYQAFLKYVGNLNYGVAGTIAFPQPTTDYTLPSQPKPPPMAWSVNEDLVLYCGLDCREPIVVGQPADRTCVPGATVTFTVEVGSPEYFNYCWLFNGNQIPGSAGTSAYIPGLTTYSLTLTNVQLTNAGRYAFAVTPSPACEFNCGGSSNALLTVLQPSLSVSNAAQGVTLSWPSWAASYALQEADGLAAPMTWSNLAVSPVLGANALRVTVQPAASHKFYRLQKQ